MGHGDMQKAETHSKAVNECMDYIHYHLHEKITVPILAEHVHLNPTYLSELFKRETGTAISQYITDKRMEAAENMLKYSEYSFDEIARSSHTGRKATSRRCSKNIPA